MKSVATLLTVLFVCCLQEVVTANAEEWPGWRGPRGDGTSMEQNVPQKWDGKTGENIAWKVPIPGRSHSSPIVWEDRVFLVTCLEEKEERALICLDRKTGKTLWQQTVLKTPLEKIHKLNSFASGTPVTDGKRVYVTFLEPDFGSKNKRTPGNMVVACYDMQGQRQWLVRPGRFASVHGYCTSPIIYKDKVIVNGDHDGDSYIAALDAATGKTVWQTKRKHKTRSYCTPIIREIGGRTQMILAGSKCVDSYDPNDGSQHWVIDGPTEQFVASLVYNGKYLFLTAGFPQLHMMAIRPDGKGNVTDSHIVWRTRKAASYVPSPISIGNYFLVASDKGIASCFDSDSGKRFWMQRLGRHYSASLITAGGLAYFLADDGVMKVVRPGKKLDVVAENSLGEYCFGSPAISRGQIFLRSVKHLYCIGKKAK